MPSYPDARRRAAVHVLLAFVAGALLTAGVLRLGPGAASPSAPATPGTAPTASVLAAPPATAASAAAAASTAADDEAVSVDDADPWPADAPTPEQVFTAQPEAVRRALSAVAPRTPGHPNVYAVAFAGDGSEDVFRNEAEYLNTLMSQRFGSAGHTVVLENNPATLSTHPLASWSNLEATLDGLAKVMDPAQDILLLYLTSHGASDHSLLVDMDPIPLDQLDPDGLADILASRGFRWKVIAVNACYSGGFVPKLRGPGTLVVTAARADRTSFGCGAESDITYFAHAWLADALNATPDFIDAFQRARGEVAQWERRDGVTPSEPQIDVGTGIEGQLAAWRKGIRLGPAVPFAAARAP